MILTTLSECSLQAGLTPGLQIGLDFLRLPARQDLPDGRIDLDGERVYALVQSYQTGLPPAGGPRFEAHRRYLDIQYIAAGVERMDWTPLGALEVSEPYQAGKDALFGRAGYPPLVTALLLRAGMLAVFYPGDAHAPKLAAGAPGAVKKIVVKVAV